MSLFKLGQWLRDRYRGFLPDKYSEKDLYVRSTEVDRTLMSAEACLAGLYPPIDNEIWNDKLMWQPIPIHTTPKILDELLAMDKPCPRYDQLKEELYQTDRFVKMNREIQDLKELMTEKTGYKVNNLKDLGDVYFTWYIEKSLFNFTLPDWVNSVYNRSYDTFLMHFVEQTYTRDMAKLKTGPFFAHILSIFDSAVKNAKNNRKGRKLTMFSAHDITIASVLNSMNLFEKHIPPYASMLLFELHETLENHQFFVNILYKNSSEPTNLSLNNCSFDCDFHDFHRLIDPISIDSNDWDGECEEKILGIIPARVNHDVIVACSTLVLLAIILGIFGIFFAYKKQKKDFEFPIGDTKFR